MPVGLMPDGEMGEVQAIVGRRLMEFVFLIDDPCLGRGLLTASFARVGCEGGTRAICCRGKNVV